MNKLSRRKFLFTLGAGLGAIGIHRLRFLNDKNNISNLSINGKRLIIIHLQGGNDGLFTLAPRNNDTLYAHRRILMGEIHKGIDWGNDLVLNAKLKDFFDLAQKGWLSIIPNVGYPKPTGSHTVSERVWASGYIPGEKSATTGWIGRLIDENKLVINDFKQTAIGFAGDRQLIYAGKINQGVNWTGNKNFESELKHMINNKSNRFKDHDVLFKELKYSYELIQLLKDIEPYPGYPQTGLGNDLAIINSIIRKNKPFKVFHLVHHGYDTHQWQAHRLNQLYNDLGKCLYTFSHELNRIGEWNNTQVLIYSEFGRSIDENSNGGTDHGTAGPVFVLGGEQIYESLVNLEPIYEIYSRYNTPMLKHQVDFRDVFKTVINNWLT